MSKRIPRPSPALVISVIALFVALGGTVYAAGKINGKTIKVKSLPGNRIKPNTVTGSQVKESSLSQVPSAANAGTAARADSAGRADSVGPGRLGPQRRRCRRALGRVPRRHRPLRGRLLGHRPESGKHAAQRGDRMRQPRRGTADSLRPAHLRQTLRASRSGMGDEWTNAIFDVTGDGDQFTAITVSKTGRDRLHRATPTTPSSTAACCRCCARRRSTHRRLAAPIAGFSSSGQGWLSKRA